MTTTLRVPAFSTRSGLSVWLAAERDYTSLFPIRGWALAGDEWVELRWGADGRYLVEDGFTSELDLIGLPFGIT